MVRRGEHDFGGCRKTKCVDYPSTTAEDFLYNNCCQLCRWFKPFNFYIKEERK